jgi:hypothetical protein
MQSESVMAPNLYEERRSVGCVLGKSVGKAHGLACAILIDIRTAKCMVPLLERFLRIRDARGVLRFARQYGVLHLCQPHGLPRQHARPAFTTGALPALRAHAALPEDNCPVLRQGEWFAEPADRWLHFVRHARALLSIASATRRGGRIDRDDWRTAYEDRGNDPDVERIVDAATADRDLSARLVAAQVAEWLHLGDVRLNLRWSQAAEDCVIDLEGGTFALLAAQLLTTVARRGAISVCNGCKQLYMPKSRPRVDRASYCNRCQADGVPARIRRQKSLDKRRADKRRKEAKSG